MAKIAYSAMVDNASGKMGTLVLTEARNGHTSRVWRKVKNPRTAKQTVVRDNLGKAARTFATLTPVQAQAWNDYGQTITEHNPLNGKAYHPAGIDIFVALATKFLQASPAGAIPIVPPSTPFTGDSVLITPSSPGAGTITFTANQQNAAGVTTELLIQKLPGRNRVPNPNGYKNAAFKAYTSGSLTQNVSVTAGNYALAYRFVKTATGQATNPVAISILTVALSLEDGGMMDVSAFEQAKPAKAMKKAA